MNGFDSLELDPRHQGAAHSTTTEVFDMTRDDIQRSIARAHRLRAEHLAAWGQRVARTWGSLFRRPRHLLPTHTRSRDRLVHSVQL
jgi:hypothetical protein